VTPPEDRNQAAEAIRALVEKIMLRPWTEPRRN
jgi:hypothetical protein